MPKVEKLKEKAIIFKKKMYVPKTCFYIKTKNKKST